MTDEQRRIEPKINIDDDDRQTGPTDTPYNGSLFDEIPNREKRPRSSSAENSPIVPNSDRVEVPPIDRSSPGKARQAGGLPLGTILGAAAMLTAAYAIWSGVGVTERIEQLEQRPTPQIEEAATQAQKIQALTKRIDELQQKLADQDALIRKQKSALEDQIKKQANRHQADMGTLIQGEEAKHKAMLKELGDQLAKSKAAAKSAAVEPPAKEAPVAAPSPKPKPVAKKSEEDMTELPGPIESASEVELPASTDRSGRESSWGINIVSLESETAAQQEVARLKEKGIQAEILETSANGRSWYRVRVAGFSSKDEAQEMQSTLAKEHGITGTWVNNQ